MSALLAPPERLTIATCIGCGAMSLPADCPGGCGPERKLELVAGAELDALLAEEAAATERGRALADVLTQFLARAPAELSDDLRTAATRALRAHEHAWPAATAALAVDLVPVVSWWCEHCGGLDAPAPCLGICIRRPAQWATLEAAERQRAACTERHAAERQLAQAVRGLLLTRPRTGRESQHRAALAEAAGRAVGSWHGQEPLPGHPRGWGIAE